VDGRVIRLAILLDTVVAVTAVHASSVPVLEGCTALIDELAAQWTDTVLSHPHVLRAALVLFLAGVGECAYLSPVWHDCELRSLWALDIFGFE
jgi:hypothetical protein